MRVVIVGAVACGTRAACRLKRLRPDIEVIMIDKDDFISYGACLLPYYLTGDIFNIDDIRTTSFKAVRDAEFFKNCKGVITLTRTLAEEIDRKKKLLKVRYLETGKTEEIAYDKLILATGAIPKIPPFPGIDLDGIFTVSTPKSAVEIKQRLEQKKVENVVIIGAGFIGLEVIEAFTDSWGVSVTLLEYFSQVLPRLIDPFLSKIVENNLRKKGVNLVLNARIKEIEGENGKVKGVRTEDNFYPADMIIIATGVRPNSELAKKAGLLVSSITGGIVVNERLQTSDPDIYAGGDCIEVTHLITGKKMLMPQGSLANRQGRIIATNIAGGYARFKGTVGSFILKCYDMSIGGCGLSYEVARQEGFDAAYAINVQHERAHVFSYGGSYYSLVFDKKLNRVLGFQAVGPFTDGTLARLHAISSLLPNNPSVEDLVELELAYSPPFNTALDPINVAGHIAENLMHDRFKPITWEIILSRLKTEDPDLLIIDVRTPEEFKYMKNKYPNWINVPYGEIRQKIDSFPKDKDIVLVCSLGTRSYEVSRLFYSAGYERVFIPMGGVSLVSAWGEDIK